MLLITIIYVYLYTTNNLFSTKWDQLTCDGIYSKFLQFTNGRVMAAGQGTKSEVCSQGFNIWVRTKNGDFWSVGSIILCD